MFITRRIMSINAKNIKRFLVHNNQDKIINNKNNPKRLEYLSRRLKTVNNIIQELHKYELPYYKKELNKELKHFDDISASPEYMLINTDIWGIFRQYRYSKKEYDKLKKERQNIFQEFKDMGLENKYYVITNQPSPYTYF
jgi:hypothetical protein